jgi:hypothetical protein
MTGTAIVLLRPFTLAVRRGPQGELEVTTVTGGTNPDVDRYTLTVDEDRPRCPRACGGHSTTRWQSIGINETVTVPSVNAGRRTVELQDVPPNCQVGGYNPQEVWITEATTSAVSFEVSCSEGSAQRGRIAFERTEDGMPPWDQDIYVIEADGTGLENLTNTGAAHREEELEWSPDGTRIAFVRDVDIYVMNADGTGLQRFTNTAEPEAQPTWSPDGSQIAFAGGDPNADIYVIDADGGTALRLTHNTGRDFSHSPDWSPDGSRIAFHGRREINREGFLSIFVINTDGTGDTRLTDNTLHPGGTFAWSADGLHIAFQSGFDIYLVDPDGSAPPVQLTSDGELFLGWSPDSRVLLYDVTDANIYLMNPDGSGLVNLTTGPVKLPRNVPESHPENLSLDWEGLRIAFADDVGDIWITAADGEWGAPLTDDPWRDSRPRWRP